MKLIDFQSVTILIVTSDINMKANALCLTRPDSFLSAEAGISLIPAHIL
ncbi:MAG: hypothetical protein SO160_04440 [Lachnospiraceae bacterium]|nr:hypothetical protein [Lachnospiraceae bacterium]